MKRVILLASLYLLMMGAKPHRSMSVNHEHISCGYECDLHDGCVGKDEKLEWIAGGSLGPGETFSYEGKEPSCAGRVRQVWAEAFKLKGKQVDILVEIDVWDSDESIHEERLNEACLEYWLSGGENVQWKVTLTNVSGRKANRLYARGFNSWNDPWGECYE